MSKAMVLISFRSTRFPAKLLVHGGREVEAYRGYVGVFGREGHLAVCPSLADLGRALRFGNLTAGASPMCPAKR
jgi:hypothetical protein